MALAYRQLRLHLTKNRSVLAKVVKYLLALIQSDEVTSGEGNMFCVSCGQQLPDEANFCPKCGVPQRMGVSEATDISKVRWETCSTYSMCVEPTKYTKRRG